MIKTTKHITLIASLIISAVITSYAQKTNFSCDFENGIPESFSTYDLDNLTPSRAMKKYGFEQGVAWVAYTEGANTVAYSGSWYTESGKPANDWLITPAIKVENTRDILSWDAYALDKTHPDGYAVYISERGNKPEDFKDAPVFSIEKEASIWTQHFISLEKWAGKDIYIAFVNNSTDSNILAIDNINVFSYNNSFSFTNLTPEAISNPGDVYVSGEITSSGFLPVEGYVVELSFNDNTYTIDNSSLSIVPGEKSIFKFDVPITTEKDKTIDYSITISSLNGTDVMTSTESITCFKRTIFIEEGTGTWCQYCPRGQYALQELHKTYPGEFIDVAVHFNDQMSVSEYENGLSQFFEGLPYCVVNRNSALMGDPYYDIETLWNKAIETGSIAKISCSANLDENKKLNIITISEFGKEIVEDTYNLAFIIVEDGVTGYPQQNAFSGSDMDLGGIENMPDVIPPGQYIFANVARAILPSFNGDPEVFPVGTPRHTTIETTHQFDMNAKVQNFENLKIVAVIIEKENGKIVNACETKLIDNSSIDKTTTEKGISISSNSEFITISSNEEIQNVEIWSTDGKLLYCHSPNAQTATIEKSHHGIAIIKVFTKKNMSTFKQIW